MITNASVTVYSKSIDENHNDIWTRHNYTDVWFFGGKGANINKGYDNANDFDCRIPYTNEGLNINDFKIGDIVVEGTLTLNITRQQDLKDYLVFNITSINNNNFGNNPHIHIGGK